MTSERCYKLSRSGALCCLLLTFAGCGNVPPIVLPNELLPEIEYVMANQADFAQDADDPLAEVVAGEVRDLLANLDGCWGAFDIFLFGDEGSPVSFALDDFEFYEFDSSTQYFEYQVLQDGTLFPFGRMVAFVSHRGTFEIAGADSIIVTKTMGMGNDPTTGDLFELPFEPELVTEAHVTVSGDRMKIRGIYDGEDDDQRAQLVFRKFDCPN